MRWRLKRREEGMRGRERREEKRRRYEKEEEKKGCRLEYVRLNKVSVQYST